MPSLINNVDIAENTQSAGPLEKSGWDVWFGSGTFDDNRIEQMYQVHFKNSLSHDRLPGLQRRVVPAAIFHISLTCSSQFLLTYSPIQIAVASGRMVCYVAIFLAGQSSLLAGQRPGSIQDKSELHNFLRLIFCLMSILTLFHGVLVQEDSVGLHINIIFDMLVSATLFASVHESFFAALSAAWLRPLSALLGIYPFHAVVIVFPAILSVAAFVSLTSIYAARRQDWLLSNGGLATRCPPGQAASCTVGYLHRSWNTGHTSTVETEASKITLATFDSNAVGAVTWAFDNDDYHSKEEISEMLPMVVEEEEEVLQMLESRMEPHMFEVWYEIGIGGFGKVYLGKDLTTGERVVGKHIGKEELMQHELLHTRHLAHPNIVDFKGHCTARPAHTYLLLEFCVGGSLDSLMRRNGKLTEEQVRVLIHDLMQGLGYLHRHGLAHCDIKPGNLLLAEGGVLKLADFGSMHSDAAPPRKRRMTIVYAAPEVLRSDVHPRLTDIWSVGCTVVEALTLRHPHFGRKPQRTFEYLSFIASCGADPQLPPGMPPLAASFARACLRIDPALRARAPALSRHAFVTFRAGEVPLASPEREVRASLEDMVGEVAEMRALAQEEIRAHEEEDEGVGGGMEDGGWKKRWERAVHRWHKWEGRFLEESLEQRFVTESCAERLARFQKSSLLLTVPFFIKTMIWPFLVQDNPFPTRFHKTFFVTQFIAGGEFIRFGFWTDVTPGSPELYSSLPMLRYLLRVGFAGFIFEQEHRSDDIVLFLIFIGSLIGPKLAPTILEWFVVCTCVLLKAVAMLLAQQWEAAVAEEWFKDGVISPKGSVEVERTIKRVVMFVLVLGCLMHLGTKGRWEDRQKFLDLM